MAVPERQRLGKRTSSRQVFSDVHKSRPCTCCTLCKNTIHSSSEMAGWNFLQSIEPYSPRCMHLSNCRDSLSSGGKNSNNYNPRWSRVAPNTKPCEVSGCIEPACRCTKLATKEEISQHLQCPLLDNLENMETSLL